MRKQIKQLHKVKAQAALISGGKLTGWFVVAALATYVSNHLGFFKISEEWIPLFVVILKMIEKYAATKVNLPETN